MSALAERYCPSCERSYHEGTLCPEDGTALIPIGNDPGRDPMLRRVLDGRYTIHERLGSGGMGTVYRATQHSVGRAVAIKVVNPGLVTNPEAIKRFLREAKLASRLAHPNATSMLDFGRTADGVFYLVMELLVGTPLDVVVRETRLELGRVIRIADQLCDVLEVAHGLSIIHRDLKPANVMLLGHDVVKVLDFGLAKSLSKDTETMSMTGTGAVLGTPAYMSPEAAVGHALDTRCDLYSLGCLLYYLASGRLPFVSTVVQELLAMQATRPAPPITGVPAGIAAVIMRLLAKDPEDRFATAAETRQALDAAYARSLRSEDEPRHRHAWRIAGTAALAIGLVAGGFVVRHLRHPDIDDRVPVPAFAPAPPVAIDAAPAPASIVEQVIEIPAAEPPRKQRPAPRRRSAPVAVPPAATPDAAPPPPAPVQTPW